MGSKNTNQNKTKILNYITKKIIPYMKDVIAFTKNTEQSELSTKGQDIFKLLRKVELMLSKDLL